MKRAVAVPNTEHERAIIDLFMAPDRRERLHMFRERRREQLVSALHTIKFLDPEVTIPIKVRMSEPGAVLDVMTKYGATHECYALSARADLDARVMPLADALREVVGISIETILFCPGTRVGYYEGGGYTPHFVLYRAAKRGAGT